MNKKVFLVSFAAIFSIGLLIYFAMPTVSIVADPPETKIMINGKERNTTGPFSGRVLWGEKELVFEKEGYITKNESLRLKPFEKKELSIQLSLDTEMADKIRIEAVSKKFLSNWYNYTKQTDKSYLESIKPFMTETYYKETEYVNTQRPQDFRYQEPLKSFIGEIIITSYSPDEGTVYATLNCTEGDNSYKLDVDVKIKKVGSEWLVSYSSAYK